VEGERDDLFQDIIAASRDTPRPPDMKLQRGFFEFRTSRRGTLIDRPLEERLES